MCYIMIIPIIEFDEKILRQETYLVDTPLTVEVKQLIVDLQDTVRAAENPIGLGLSAPQVNRSEKIFVVNNGPHQYVMINPKIVRRWGKITTYEESCLSLPDVSVFVPRPKFVKIDYTDEHGVRHVNKKFHSMNARIIQHEDDHLDGLLITDYRRRS